MSLLDVRAMVKELKTKILGLRLANLYHLSSRIFLLKLSGTDVKQFVIVESGVRMHTTQYGREHDKQPSNFCVKLRKHLRLKRLEGIAQLGLDRVVDMTFGRGADACHLMLEFYAQGNIILTDANYQILMVLRTHTYEATPQASLPAAESKEGDDAAASSALPTASPSLGSGGGSKSQGGKSASKSKSQTKSKDSKDPSSAGAGENEDRVAVRALYPMQHIQQPPTEVSVAMIRACLEKQLLKEKEQQAQSEALLAAQSQINGNEDETTQPRESEAGENPDHDHDADADPSRPLGKKQHAAEQSKKDARKAALQAEEAKKRLLKQKMKQGMPLKAVLAQDLHFGPDIIEHCLLLSSIDPNQTVSAFLASNTAASSPTDAQPPTSPSPPSPSTLSSSHLSMLSDSLQEAPKLLDKLSRDAMPGYIFYRKEEKNPATRQATQGKEKGRKKKEKTKQPAAGELIVDQMQLGATVAGAVAAAAVPSTDKTAADAAALDSSTDASQVDSSASASVSASSSSSVPSDNADSNHEQNAEFKEDGKQEEKSDDKTVTVYLEYVPMLLSTHRLRPEYRSLPPPLAFPSLDAAMDEFYSRLEEQKEQMRLIKEEQAALAKLEREKQRQTTQLAALEQQQRTSTQKAQLIESNLDAVTACIMSVNAEIAKGTDWRDLTRMIAEEKRTGRNPVAMSIHSLRLLENQITMTLSEGMRHLAPDQASLPKSQRTPFMHVDIDLALSAFANAQNYYQNRKKNAAKKEKAETASQQAIASAERKTQQALAQVDQRSRIQKLRKVYWFEKFHWFISSENFLVIGGRDAQQNETLVKKYLQSNDAYVHAEVHGASSVIVKNHTNGPIPPLTLQQAGCMTICRSAAWKNKVVVEAYWVHADQVSKTPPTGLYLPTGSFMIRGKKNFLPRLPLVMGIGLLFRVDEESLARHANERRVRAVEEGVTEAEVEAGMETREGVEDKFDQVAELPSESGMTAKAMAGGGSNKKKNGGSSRRSSSSKKKKSHVSSSSRSPSPSASPPAVVDDDFDVTSSLSTALANASIHTARLSSEDEDTDADEESKSAQLPSPAKHDEPSTDTFRAPQGKKKSSAAERRRLKKMATGGPNPAPSRETSEQQQEQTGQDEENGAQASRQRPADDSSDSDDDWGKQNKDKKKKKGKKKSAASTTSASADASSSSSSVNAPPQPLPRGKRNKLKRIASKYANQDAEDVELAAQLLGLQNVEKKKKEAEERERKFRAKKEEEEKRETQQEEAQEQAERPAGANDGANDDVDDAPPSPVAVEPVDDASEKACFLCSQRGHVFKNCPQRDTSSESALSFAAARRAALAQEQAEVEALAAEEGIEIEQPAGMDARNTTDELAKELAALTGQPHSLDTLLYALPMCAPYSALTPYTYKVKLLPGSAKKGASAQQSLRCFMGVATASHRSDAEKDCIKRIKDQELIDVLLAAAKVVTPAPPGAPPAKGKGKKGGKK